MARPLLADAEFVNKAAAGRADEINTCIACNQACLDHVFQRKLVSCLVNPRACHELELRYEPAPRAKRIAVVGAGPAGTVLRNRARGARARGRPVRGLGEIGGQFNLAMRVPGKEEFRETLRYFTRRIAVTGVRLHLGARVDAQQLLEGGYDEVIVATGVTARDPHIPGADAQRAAGRVLSYAEVLLGERAGGPACGDHRRRRHRLRRRGVPRHRRPFARARPRRVAEGMGRDRSGGGAQRPGCCRRSSRPPARSTCCNARRRGSAKGSARPPGWIHRAALRMKRVEMMRRRQLRTASTNAACT